MIWRLWISLIHLRLGSLESGGDWGEWESKQIWGGELSWFDFSNDFSDPSF
jgi:hypothetical protein